MDLMTPKPTIRENYSSILWADQEGGWCVQLWISYTLCDCPEHRAAKYKHTILEELVKCWGCKTQSVQTNISRTGLSNLYKKGLPAFPNTDSIESYEVG